MASPGPSSAHDAPAPQNAALFAFLRGFGAAHDFDKTLLPLSETTESALHAQLDAFLCGAPSASSEDSESNESNKAQVEKNKLRLFGSSEGDDEEKDLPLEYRKSQMGKACGHVFKKGEAVWRCRTCALDDTCVFCSRCFHNSNHQGHETSFSITSGGGGCCDCGDKEAWKIDSGCKYHSLSASTDPKLAEKLSTPLEPQLEDSINSTIATVLDFILFALAKAPLHPATPPMTAAAVRSKAFSSTPRDEYTLNLWNDETHSFDDVIRALTAKLFHRNDTASARQVASAVDVRGRAILKTSSNVPDLLSLARQIAEDSRAVSFGGLFAQAVQMRKPPLALTIQPLSQTFYEEIAHSCLAWLRMIGKRIVDLRGEESVRRAICRELGVGKWMIPDVETGVAREVSEEELAKDFVVFRGESRVTVPAATADTMPPLVPVVVPAAGQPVAAPVAVVGPTGGAAAPAPAPVPDIPMPPLSPITSSESSASESGGEDEPPALGDIDSASDSDVHSDSDGGHNAGAPAVHEDMPALSEIESTDDESDDDSFIPDADDGGGDEEDEEFVTDEGDLDADDEDDEQYETEEDDEDEEDDDEDMLDIPPLTAADIEAVLGELQNGPGALENILAAMANGGDDDEEESDVDDGQPFAAGDMDVDMAFPPGGLTGAGAAGQAPPAPTGPPPEQKPVAVSIQEQQGSFASSGPPSPISGSRELPATFDVPPLQVPAPPPVSSEPPRSRLDVMLSWDLKMWKEMRLWLRELYIGTFVVTGEEYKTLLGLKFASNYVTLGSSQTLLDREPLQAIFLLAVQLFTVPTVAQRVLLHPTRNFVAEYTTLLRTIFTLTGGTAGLTEQTLRAAFNRALQTQKDLYLPTEITFKYDSLRMRDIHHHFLNIHYLASAAPQAFRAKYVTNLQWLFAMLAVFQGCNAQKRAAIQHVEFENDWVDPFNVTRYAAELSQVVAHGFSPSQEPGSNKLNPLDPESWHMVRQAVRIAYEAVAKWCSAETSNGRSPTEHARVLDSKMSFLHPMHWTLGQFLAKMQQVAVSRSLGAKAQGSLGIGAESASAGKLRVWKQVFDLEPGPNGQVSREKVLAFQAMLLRPLRVQAMVAQVRANLWVRNGDAIRMQAYHYRFQSLREVGYDLDLVVLQAAACIANPETFLRTMVNVFNLEGWFEGKSASSALSHGMEARQMSTLAEDFFELLIFLLTERSVASGMSFEEEAKREIRHHLAVHPSGMSYSALLKKVSDKATESPTEENLEHRFEQILKSMSTFKAPDATREYGVYQLHDKEFDEVDPWFWHYSRNERGEVMEVLKRRLAEKKAEAKVHITKPTSIVSNTPFSLLADLVHDPQFTSILFFSIWNCTKRFDATLKPSGAAKTWSSDDLKEAAVGNLLEASLHLCVVACQEEVEGSASSISKRHAINAEARGFFANAVHVEFDIPAADGKSIAKRTLLSVLLDCIEQFGGGMALSESVKLKARSDSYAQEASVVDLIPKMYWIVQKLEEWGSDEARRTVAEWRIRVAEGQQDEGATDENARLLQEQERKKQAAKQRQAAILAQMKAQQQQFMVNQGLENESEDDEEEAMGDDAMEVDETADGDQAGFGLRQRTWKFPSGSCIVCQEEADKDSDLYGMLGYVQTTRLARPLNPEDPSEVATALASLVSAPASMDQDFGLATRVPSTSQGDGADSLLKRQCRVTQSGICATTCGHIMHSKCFTDFLSSIAQRLNQQRGINHPEQDREREFMCPMCKSLGNVLLPIVASVKVEKVNILPVNHEGRDISGSAEDPAAHLATWTQQAVSQRDLLGKLRDGALSAGSPSRKRPAPPESPPADIPMAEGTLQMGLSLRERFQRTLGQIIPSLFGGSPAPVSRSTAESAMSAAAKLKGARDLRFAYNARVLVVMKEVRNRSRPRVRSEMSYGELLEMLWSSFADTIKSYETAARGTGSIPGEPVRHKGQPLIWLSTLSNNQVTLLRLLCETILGYANMLMGDDPEGQRWDPADNEREFRGRSSKLVSMLFAGLLDNKDREGGNAASKDSQPLLVRDGLSVFTEIVSTIVPATSNPADEDDDMWSWTRLAYLAEVVRTALAIAFLARQGGGLGEIAADGEPSTAFPFAAGNLVRLVAESAGISDMEILLSRASDEVVQKLFTAMLLSTLRQYALVLHARFGIVPQSLEDLSKSTSFGVSVDVDDESEFDRLTAYLRLPTLADICLHLLPVANDTPTKSQGESLRTLVHGWCESFANWRVAKDTIQAAQDRFWRDDPRILQLSPLPDAFTTLIETSIAFICPRCGKTPTDPALCLFCGDFVCAQSYCCQSPTGNKGECSMHNEVCGGDVGIFFLVKKGIVIYLNRKNGTFVSMPYLDSHGESDVGLRRGRPAFLSAKRFADIRKTWLSLQVPQMIARKIEGTYSQTLWESY